MVPPSIAKIAPIVHLIPLLLLLHNAPVEVKALGTFSRRCGPRLGHCRLLKTASIRTRSASSMSLSKNFEDKVAESYCLFHSSLTAKSQNSLLIPTRREALQHTARSILLSASVPSLWGSLPSQSLASPESTSTGTNNDKGIVSTSQLATLLQPIPTFAIVDPRGVPYFVVGEDAKLTSYFFISYGEARRILNVAISSADKAIVEGKKDLLAKKKRALQNEGKGSERVTLTKEEIDEIGTNPWKSARITTVPLDVAVSLASKGKLAGAYFRLAPSESDIEDALELDGSDDLPEGRVPLFYVEDMTISASSGGQQSDGDLMSPLYFQKDQLIAEWKRQQKKQNNDTPNSNIAGEKESKATPNIKVTELFATITEMVKPGGTDDELNTLVFVAPPESKAKAEQCKKRETEPFRLGERLIVL